MNLTCISIKNETELNFKEKRKEVSVPLCDVVFFESCGHYITIHTNSLNTYSTRCTMAELADLVLGDVFVRVHNGIIVNLSYVKRLDYKGAVLNSAWRRVPVSRTRRESAEAAFEKFKRKI